MKPRRLSDTRNTALSPLELGRSGGVATVTYRALEGGWWLWLPCRSCGGVALPLRDAPADESLARDRWCPRCETLRRRLECSGPEPTVWYDTWIEDWVVRLPCHGLRDGVLMPMEIRWFDTAWAEVIRVAADVVYGSDSERD